MDNRLKTTQVQGVRMRITLDQGGRCAICKGKIGIKPPFDAVLDHDHSTGAVRGVLHRGCNSLLGKVENNAARYGVREVLAFCSGLSSYLLKHATNVTGMIHPTHKTEDEKRLRRNARARASRLRKKEAA